MCSSDLSLAMNTFMASGAGQDMYAAFLSSAGYPYAPPAPVPAAPVPQAQLPPGFVVPAGYKLVRAGPEQACTQDMPYPGPWPFTNMNQSRQDAANDRPDLESIPDSETKRPQPQLKSFNADGGKLFVGGLSSGTTADTLRAHFSSYGKVVGASVIKDPATKRGRGFGFVEFDGGIPAAAMHAEGCLPWSAVGEGRPGAEAKLAA